MPSVLSPRRPDCTASDIAKALGIWRIRGGPIGAAEGTQIKRPHHKRHRRLLKKKSKVLVTVFTLMETNVNGRCHTEVNPAIQNMAKLTLSMINYRIAQSLLSLNLTIGEEPVDPNLFSRVHATKVQAAEQTAAVAAAEPVVSLQPTNSSVPPNKTPNAPVGKRGQDQHSKNSHKGHPPTVSAKRSLSASLDEAGREDHPHKRQRAQSAEEEGIVKERPTPGT